MLWSSICGLCLLVLDCDVAITGHVSAGRVGAKSNQAGPLPPKKKINVRIHLFRAQLRRGAGCVGVDAQIILLVVAQEHIPRSPPCSDTSRFIPVPLAVKTTFVPAVPVSFGN